MAGIWQVKPGPQVGYTRHMRLHITVDDGLVAELDRRAGSRRRSAFIAELIRRGLDDERRWDDIEAALGAIPDEGHEWDDDPGEWVRRQRSDRRRVG
jgi:Arc/MetJ family transcription regulator